MKISQVITGYWLDRELELSKNTVTTYGYYFKSFVEFAGDVEFASITSNDIKRYLVWIVKDKGLSKRTASDRWIALASLWKWAANELKMPNIISGIVKRPKFTKTVIEPFTSEELQTIIAIANKQSIRTRAIIYTLADSGIRVSELCNALVGDYNQDSGRLHIRHGKGDKDRIIYLGNGSRKALWKMLALRKEHKGNEPLFATTAKTKLDRNNIRRLIHNIGLKANISKAHPHKFRHTFAVSFLRNGGNLKQLQSVLGHESMVTCAIYLKLAEVDLEQARSYSPVDNL